MIQQGKQGIPQGERERGDIDGHANRSAESVASAIQDSDRPFVPDLILVHVHPHNFYFVSEKHS
jgi:hypothetical protein